MSATLHDPQDVSIFFTGSGNGIGAALAKGFLAQGAKVAFAGRSDASACVDEMAEKRESHPLFIRCDIKNTPSLQSAFDRAVAAHEPHEVLVNNAANDMRYDAMDITEEIWDTQEVINLKACLCACQKAAKIMAPKGPVINYSSITYMVGAPGMMPYVSANAIAPSSVFTDKQETQRATPATKVAVLQKQCLQEFIQPSDMVGGTQFLAAQSSAMMTGQTLAIDAGVVGTG